MTYGDANEYIGQLKEFVRNRIEIQDKRNKKHALVKHQLDEAYYHLCLVMNHLNVVQRYEKVKGGNDD